MRQAVSIGTALGASLLVLAGGCRRETIEDRIDALPELPAGIADTLDAKTRATKIPASYPAPERAAGPLLAPCCGIQDFKTLQVRFSYTKCAPLRDFVLVRAEHDLVLDPEARGPAGAGQPGVQVHRLGARNARSAFDTIICMTSDGPWSAAFREDRSCVGYMPQDSLVITALGDPILFVWNGGSQNHPAGIDLVSCRQVSNLQAPCNPSAGCDCTSSSCPADQPCACTLQW
jgi:hypothetical protein